MSTHGSPSADGRDRGDVGTLRRGGIYIAVLGASMMVTVLGLSALMLARIEGRSAVAESDIAEARRCALAGIEITRYAIQSNANWRSLGSGPWGGAVSLGRGQYSASVTDPTDDDLADDASELILITSVGTAGRATQYLTATLMPQTPALDCLNAGVHADGAVTLSNATVVSDRMFGSNVSVTATSSSVQSNVEAVGAIAGGTYANATTTGIPDRAMPTAAAITAWASAAVDIKESDLLSGGGGSRVLEKIVLGPGSNPFPGGTSAAGLYVIDMKNKKLTLQNCRIIGTLILLNPGVGSTVTGSVRWDVPVANQPALLVSGDLVFATSQAMLNEATIDKNLNPTGCAYIGSTDTDKVDVYPSSVCGLIYASGNLVCQGYNVVNGVVLAGGTLSVAVNSSTGVAGRLDLTYKEAYLTTPPAGFSAPTRMVLDSNGLVQTVK